MTIIGDDAVHVDDAPVGSTIASVAAPDAALPVRVPVDRYVSPGYAALEQERLWPRVWQIACSLDAVAHPGDFFEYRVGTLTVVVVRGQDGVLRAFQNVCLHRGNALCEGHGGGLTELRCPYHRWAWTLDGRLREVPSRKGFGPLRNDDLPLVPVQVDTWGPIVFVNLDPDAAPLAEFLGEVPADCAWADLDEFRCVAQITQPAPCNWKTLIDAFSETYHVQGIHREMLRMADDVNSPQVIWDWHGKLEQPYGVQSPRLRATLPAQEVWEGFVEVMGGRMGVGSVSDAGPVPEIPDGRTLRDVLADRIRAHQLATRGCDLSRFSTAQVMDLQQYNLFPNVTVLVFADMLQVVKSRPGATPDDAWMDVFSYVRAPDPSAPRTAPMVVDLPHAGAADLGLVLNQDVANFARAQRGLHQPGFTHLTLSGEECRIINLHRNLDRFL